MQAGQFFFAALNAPAHRVAASAAHSGVWGLAIAVLLLTPGRMMATQDSQMLLESKPALASPVFSPLPGTFSGPVTVAITDPSKVSAVYYTTDGKPPSTASKRYASPIDVTSTETIRATALSGADSSMVASATYTIDDGVTAPAVITATPARNGAALVRLRSNTQDATIYYTTDGSAPSRSSIPYLAPFLVDRKMTVKAIAISSSDSNSPVTEHSFDKEIPAGALVWSDEFPNATGENAEPDPHIWTYDTGTDCCGNNEWEDYCAWDSSVAPCAPAHPNAYVGTDGDLHILARDPVAGAPKQGNYTSARLKTQGLFSFQYGRFEVRAKIPEGQGLWPAIWLLGNNIATVNWPACGELDVMEHIDGGDPQNEGFDWVQGSIHGTNLNNGIQYHPAGFSAADWHIYGMIWTKGKIEYYVDSPANVYATFTPSTQGGSWPFDSGPEFVILNLAVGGDWPGQPDAATPFPSQFLVDFVRVYSN